MAKVAVVGSYAVGLVMNTAKVPHPGETVLGKNFEETHGGKGSNQAIAASRLGANASFIGRVGEDHYGKDALELHENENVDREYFTQTSNKSTGAGFIIVDSEGENSIVVTPGANSTLDQNYVNRAKDKITEADILLTQLEIPLQAAVHAGKLASNHNVTSILNPAPAPENPINSTKLANFELVTPNYTEACALAGLSAEDEPEPKKLLDILTQKGAHSVLLTLGGEGSMLKAGNEVFKIKAPEVNPVDTTGAGDVFNAALAVALAEGKTLKSGEAIEFASGAGALAVTKNNVIPSIPTREDLENFLSKE